MRAIKFLVVSTAFLFCEIKGQNVNKFTGSFNYNLPLINLPSNRGAGITIDANYNAGIQMEQPASEIGLGWNINAGGAIYRSVSGVPDDVKAFVKTDFNTTYSTVAQGALYPDYVFGTTEYDLNRSTKGLDTSEFTTPGFDGYSLVAPAFSGQLQLSYRKFYPYKSSATTPYNLLMDQTTVSGYSMSQAPQFHFVGDFADTLVSRHYPDTINSGTTFTNIPTATITGLGYTTSIVPFIGKHLNGSTISDQNFDPTTGRLGTSNFVEYFTNYEIDNGTVSNMMDYKAVHTRTASIWPAEGIGYFRVTASNGLTYHYSLPVYQLESNVYRVPLDNDYTNSSGLATSDFGTGVGVDVFPNPNLPIAIRVKDNNKYANKWLLTAITGPDFVDDGDGVVNDADAGYWVAYDYQVWNEAATERIPKYGYDYQYSPDLATQQYPVYFSLIPTGSGTPYKLSGLFGTVSVNKTEVYYLSKIRTSSHTAVLVRDIRKDEKVSDDAIVTSSFTPAPNLLVKRVLLFKNDHLDSLLGSVPTVNFNTANYPQFDFAATTNSASTGFFTEDWYTSISSSAPYCILKHIYFDQDYSLCKKYHGNVEADCSGSSVLTPATVVQTSLTVGTYSASGKLTLNRILTYDFQNQKIIPSTVFDYDATNTTNAYSNPDYNPLKADYWGYYKSDATVNAYSRYTNTVSMANTDAWSLKKILDPMGGITEMEYESNSYQRVLDNKSTNGVRGAAFMYRLKDVNDLYNYTPSCDVLLEEPNTGPDPLNEIGYISASAGCSKRIVIPYFQNVYEGNFAWLGSSIIRGFQFGDYTFTLTANNAVGSMASIASVGAVGALYSSTSLSDRTYIASSGAGLIGVMIQGSHSGTTAPAYGGNGYILFETTPGYEVYGGGIRVKQLKSKNNANEIYVKEYTYEDGVASNEMDRFAYPRLKAYATSQTTLALKPRYGFLEPKDFSPFEMAPNIGYTKVTERNLGRINSDNGKIETTFITTPAQLPYSLTKNYVTSTYANAAYSASVNLNTINECVSSFPNVFGAAKETKVYDKNNNMLSRSVNDYTTTQQGALTEEYYFSNNTLYPGTISNTVCIVREIPIVLKSSTTYGMDAFETTQSVARDELTGETTAMQSFGKNNSSSVSYKIPAYKYYFPVEGIDFTSADSRKIMPLGRDMYSYGNIDTTLATNSFLSAAYKLYSKTINQRQYIGSVYTTTQITLPYYFNNRSFMFDAGQGSANNYGLLDKANLYSNPLSLATINNSVYWEPGSTYNWKLVTENTLIDNYKNLVETRDANNRFSASRYGYDGYYKTASVTNCNYASFTYANFENAAPSPSPSAGTIDGDIYSSSLNLVDYNTVQPHTGSKCIAINSTPASYTVLSAQSPSNTMETGLQSGRIYRASVWTHSTNLSHAVMTIIIDGLVNVAVPYSLSNTITVNSSNNLITTIGNWNLLQVDVEIPEKFTTNLGLGGSGIFKIELSSTSGTVYFDDLIFHPVESDFSASVYNPRNGRMMSSLDGNGLATNYFYDAAGRVAEVWKEIPSVGYKKIKRHTYNYARGAAN